MRAYCLIVAISTAAIIQPCDTPQPGFLRRQHVCLPAKMYVRHSRAETLHDSCRNFSSLGLKYTLTRIITDISEFLHSMRGSRTCHFTHPDLKDLRPVSSGTCIRSPIFPLAKTYMSDHDARDSKYTYTYKAAMAAAATICQMLHWN